MKSSKLAFFKGFSGGIQNLYSPTFVCTQIPMRQSYRDNLDFLTTRKGQVLQEVIFMANALRKPVRHDFLKRFAFFWNLYNVWGTDLVYIQKWQNSGFQKILMVIDVFSKYGWAVPLKNKSPPEVSQALQQLLQEIIVKNNG